MEALILIALIVMALVALGGRKAGRRRGRHASGKGAGFQSQARLFSPAERSFLGVLDQAVGPGVRVFAKVRIADVISPEKGLSRSEWQRLFNRIARKHFDFLLCDARDLSLLAVVELDDASHRDPKRQARDRFVDEACSSAGLVLLRFPVQSQYNLDEMARHLKPVLAKTKAAGVATPGRDVPAESSKAPSTGTADAQASESSPSPSMICPRCGAALVRRTARRGEQKGMVFYGCSNYPRCRFTAAADEGR